MTKPKILTVVAALPDSGGVATVVYAVQNEVNKSGEIENDVVVVKYYDSWFKKIIKKIRGQKIEYQDKRYVQEVQSFPNQRITIIQIPSRIFRKKNRSQERMAYLERLFELDSYDSIHAHYYKDYTKTVLEISQKYHKKALLTIHGSDTIGLNNTDIACLNQFDALTYASNFLQQTVTKVGEITTLQRVISNGYNDQVFYLKNQEKTRMNIAYCGSLSDIKGVDALKQIFLTVAQQCPKYHFQIYGDGPKKADLQAFFQQHQLQVTFFGNVKQQELSDAFQEMKVLILPSKREGYPCIVQEAKACGVYVVATDVGGTAEALGEIGTLVTRTGAFEAEMALKVVDYLNGEQFSAQIISKDHVHNWQKIAKQYVQLYQELAK